MRAGEGAFRLGARPHRWLASATILDTSFR